MNWQTIFRDAVAGLIGVCVYDKGAADLLGRYVVAKTMKLASGRVRSTQTDYHQRPAAIRRAKIFLAQRAAKAGREYVPGDGEKTWGFKTVRATRETGTVLA